MNLIDLSHTLSENTPVYPGDSRPEFKQVSFFENKGYRGFEVKSVMHVGTHIDAPFHMLENGKKLSEIPLDKFFGQGKLLDARGKKEIDVDLLQGVNINKGDIVFVLTGSYKKFGSEEYFKNRPLLTESFAKRIVELGVNIVGIDTPGPDIYPYNIHKILLASEVLIIENLTNLEELIGKTFEVFAFPARIALDGAPVRVVAKIL